MLYFVEGLCSDRKQLWQSYSDNIQ